MTIEELEAEIAEDEAIEREMVEVQAEIDLQNESDLVKAGRTVGQGFQIGAKALGYLQGAITSPIYAGVRELMTGKDVYRGQEHLDALNPFSLKMFPDFATMDRRAGDPEGGSLAGFAPELIDKGGALDISELGVRGFAKDIFWDPMNLISFGAGGPAKKALVLAAKEARAAAKVEKTVVRTLGQKKNPLTGLGNLLADLPGNVVAGAKRGVRMGVRPLSIPAEHVGKGVYRKGLLGPAQTAERFGQDFADAASRYGVTGTSVGVKKKINAITKTLKEKRDALGREVDELGAEVDVTDAFQGFEDELLQAQRDGVLSAREVNSLYDDVVDTFLEKNKIGPINTEVATKWKTHVRERLANSEFQSVKGTSLQGRLIKKAAGGLQDAIEAAGEKVQKGFKKNYHEMNSDLGVFLTSQESVLGAAEMAEKYELFGSIDAAYGAGGLATSMASEGGANLLWAPAAISAKKLLDFGQSTMFRTKLGSGLRAAGENRIVAPLMDASARGVLKLPGDQPDEGLHIGEPELIYRDSQGNER